MTRTFGHVSLSLKFEYDPISGCWDIPLLIFWGRLPLRLSSIEVIFHWGGLHLKNLYNIVRSSQLSSKFDWDPISGYSDFPLSIFWGCHPLEFVFIWRIYKTRFGDINFSLTFEYGPINGCWDIPLLTFWGCLSLEVVFIRRIYKIWGRLPHFKFCKMWYGSSLL
jgi:hypothetical protein